MFKKSSFFRIIIGLLSILPLGLASQSLIDYVDPFIGTSNFGATHPGAVVPRGMVSVVPFNVTGSPDNVFDKDARWWSTPYVKENSFFSGYTHVNLSGVGCPELGVIRVMPTTGDLEVDLQKYGSVYTDEKASPGYYTNTLSRYGIRTEVTATSRVGISRFHFPAGQSHVLIDLGSGLTNETGGSIRIVNEQEVEGWRMTGGFCYNDGSERPVYFVARVDRVAEQKGVWKKMPPMQAEASWSATNDAYKTYPNYQYPMAGDTIGAYLSFTADTPQSISVKVGVSYVSMANARDNLDAEMPGYDFEESRQQAEQQWEEVLFRIRLKGGTIEQQKIFYTALYHIHLHPNVINDVNGQYPQMENFGVGQTKDRNRYTVFSLWDTYRNLHPFLSLVYPDVQTDMLHSMLDMYRESEWLPKWELNSRETHVMEGDPAIPVIVDS